MPNNVLALHSADPDQLRTRLRSNIMMVQKHKQAAYCRADRSLTLNTLPYSAIDSRLGRRRPRKVSIVVESGSCFDTRYAGKVAEKSEQYERLIDMLKKYGYDV